VFFDSLQCVVCGAMLGFDPRSLSMTAQAVGDQSADGQALRMCRNRIEYNVCNWWLPANAIGHYCDACALTEVIPNLSVQGNLVLWERMERAKRRLLYDLIRLQLYVPGGGPLAAPTFRFLEDSRHNPLVEESFVLTGHYAGTITINLAEADDSLRHAVREQMRERYRTLLGHLRHESGHLYFDALVKASPQRLDEFRALFGDERVDYAASIEHHYQRIQTEPVDSGRFISSYAASHPLEDWAETWSHCLHIAATLETAVACGIGLGSDGSGADWVRDWTDLSVTINELSRSLGVDDPYPFALSPTVVAKLEWVRGTLPRAPGSH
jgi:hypothetical protein